MHVIKVTNVNQALAEGLIHLYHSGIEEKSRNGDVIVSPGPVTTVYTRPWERVLFSPMRDANPFFHLFESLWMLAGRNDIAFPAYFAKQMLQYSDDGVTQRGAYGYRWRRWFGYDQLAAVIKELQRDPESRRCVLGMWDAGHYAYGTGTYQFPEDGDLCCTSKDKPCNTHIYVDCRGGKLNITVCCRSNDIWWGAYGANAVHFSFLQEYLAVMVGVSMGEYRQISNNYHIYTSIIPEEKFMKFALDAQKHDYYLTEPGWALLPKHKVISSKMVEGPWLEDLKRMLNYDVPIGTVRPRAPLSCGTFLDEVAWPMLQAYCYRKEMRSSGFEWIHQIAAPDWFKACKLWVERKEQKKAQKESVTA